MNMLHPNRYILLSFFFFLTGICFAQPYYFRHYQVESGLSNNAVFATAQDKQGFMWFGTKDGLNRIRRSVRAPALDYHYQNLLQTYMGEV